MDVASAVTYWYDPSGKVTWLENLGGSNLAPPVRIATVLAAISVSATDRAEEASSWP